MRGVVVALILLSVPILASAIELTVKVRNATGAPLDEAVVWAIPKQGELPPSAPDAVMDQKNRMFVPHVLAVRTGTAVQFPNSDNVRHQVYSFSPAKRFQLPLYEGSPAEPVIFDKAGVVSLGCNIHDRMSAYIVVVDTPFFGVTKDGTAALRGLTAGSYTIHVWHAKARSETPPRSVELKESGAPDLVVTIGSR